MHLIALGIKQKFNIPWIADFRDPWTDIDFYSKLRLTKRADKIHHKMENQVLAAADRIVTVSPGCAKDLQKIRGKQVEVIYNGFDPEDYQFETPELDKNFSITHFGAFNKDRNPVSLWSALKELSAENQELKELLIVQLIGQTDDSVINDIKKNNLAGNLKVIDHLPHRAGLLQLSSSQLLLLPLNNAPNVKGILPGKMYEYLALKRPIVAIGPTNADYVKIIKETNSGFCHNPDDIEGLKATIKKCFNLFKKNNLVTDSNSYEKFSRKNQAKKIMDLAASI
jgi:glycosyltransferase involved in cell wall biosynthesis